MNRPVVRTAIDLGAVALLLSVAVIGFGPTFDGPQYLVAGFGAIIVGLAVAWFGQWLRWGILSVAGVTVAVYFPLGGALALPHTALLGVIPTLETWRQLAVGTVTSFKALLTTVPPVAASDGHLVVPFLLTLVAAVIAGSLALRVRPAAWALLPALALTGLQILLGAAQPAAPLVQGIVFAAVAVVWLALRQTWDGDSAAQRLENAAATPSRPLRARRLIAGGAVLALAAGVGVATAAFGSTPTQRYILRDFVVPPFDVHQYPSPLQAWRGYIRDDADATLFTAAGLPEDARVRLATMDAYNGIVYNVSDDGAGSSSAFTPVRSNMSPTATGTPTTVRIDIGDYAGVWLPDVGAVRDIAFDGDRAGELRRSAHFNDATGTAVVTAGLRSGDAYTLQTLVSEVPSDAALADAAFAPLSMPKQEGVPESLSKLAAENLGEAETPIERVRALQDWLSTDGYFSHGLADDVFSPSGHGAARITMLFSNDQMIGDDEQYAVAMALLARQLGMPARVVMGWYPGEDETDAGVFTATGDNLHAWVEVAFDGFGWVPFDPTPDEDNEPNDQNTKPQANPKPQVLQPPPPAQEPADLPPTIADDREQDDDTEPGVDWLGTVLLWGGIGLGTVALLLAPFIVLGLIKGARRARRRNAERTADRISGGWDEIVDTAVDLRTPVVPGATRAESATIVGSRFEEPRVTTLATWADADVYGPGDPSPEDVEAFWREVDALVGGMRQKTSWWQRLGARLSLRSLRRGRST
ncbi:transglutaminase-like domain-containing protein [Microbacterium sp. LjRoot45]|uniref:transglutaminase-like domain-containing protein n=1 Tax=Microbacterium sp. LjRoot45 TaxID=3342329 RepID=UPI003ECE9320